MAAVSLAPLGADSDIEVHGDIELHGDIEAEVQAQRRASTAPRTGLSDDDPPDLVVVWEIGNLPANCRSAVEFRAECPRPVDPVPAIRNELMPAVGNELASEFAADDLVAALGG